MTVIAIARSGTFVLVALVLLSGGCIAQAQQNPELDQRFLKWKSYFDPGVRAAAAKDYDRAEKLFQQAYDEIKPLGITSAAAATVSNLCMVYESKSNFQRAKVYCNDAVGISQRLRGKLHYEVAFDLFRLAVIERKLENYKQALQFLASSIDIMIKTGNGKKQTMKFILEEFALNYERTGDNNNAKFLRDEISKVEWEK
jgi:tetratricopeptide (TPR) repeat protein